MKLEGVSVARRSWRRVAMGVEVIVYRGFARDVTAPGSTMVTVKTLYTNWAASTTAACLLLFITL